MLVLSRRKDESVTITINGIDVVVSILKSSPTYVKIGFSSDNLKDVVILRTELLSEKK